MRPILLLLFLFLHCSHCDPIDDVTQQGDIKNKQGKDLNSRDSVDNPKKVDPKKPKPLDSSNQPNEPLDPADEFFFPSENDTATSLLKTTTPVKHQIIMNSSDLVVENATKSIDNTDSQEPDFATESIDDPMNVEPKRPITTTTVEVTSKKDDSTLWTIVFTFTAISILVILLIIAAFVIFKLIIANKAEATEEEEDARGEPGDPAASQETNDAPNQDLRRQGPSDVAAGNPNGENEPFRIPSTDIQFRGPLTMTKGFRGEMKHDLENEENYSVKPKDVIFDPNLNEAVAIGDGIDEAVTLGRESAYSEQHEFLNADTTRNSVQSRNSNMSVQQPPERLAPT